MRPLTAVILLLLFGGPSSGAPRYHRAPHIQLALRSQMSTLPRGEWVWVGIHQRLESHWHTYWRNPGDSGLPPKISWHLPHGVKVSALHWPLPAKIRVKHLANYGYGDQVLLLARLMVPRSYSAQTITLKGTFDWLVCKESCIPGKATLQRELAVAEKGIPAGTDTQKIFAAALAALPLSGDSLTLRFSARGSETLDLTVRGPTIAAATGIELLPIDATVVHNAAPQIARKVSDGWVLTLRKHEYFSLAPKRLRAVLAVTEVGGRRRGFSVTIALPQRSGPLSDSTRSSKRGTPGGNPPIPGPLRKSDGIPGTDAPSSANAPPLAQILAGWHNWEGGTPRDLSLWQAFLFALLGGLILNLMPCVFPVLSLKVLHFVKKADAEASDIRGHGIAFWLGIQVSFSLLAIALVGLRAAGEHVGWGFQLQLPHVVFLLMAVLFGLGLWLSGLFELGHSVMGIGQSFAQREGYSGSFFTGVLAVIVATPCTAPLMGPPIAFALSKPIWISLPLFNALALGMALPYLLLSFFPRALRYLPKPGAWMERVKQLTAFPMFAATVWLLWVLGNQAGREGIISALAVLTALAFGAWLFGTTRAHRRRRLFAVLAVLLSAGALGIGVWQIRADARRFASRQAELKSAFAQLGVRGKSGDLAYGRARLAALLAQRHTVFVNMTADWCISCKVNEKVALNRDAVKADLARRGIVRLVGDWTNRGAEIGAFLQHFKRSGVPLYVIFHGPTKRYMILPQLLTQQTMLESLKKLDEGVSSQARRKR